MGGWLPACWDTVPGERLGTVLPGQLRAASPLIGMTGFPAEEKDLDEAQTAPHHTGLGNTHFSSPCIRSKSSIKLSGSV